jgi:hypothetical protein
MAQQVATQEMVSAALDRAVQNGCEEMMLLESLTEVANDIVDYDSDFAGIKPRTLLPFIKVWRKQHSAKK